MIFKNHKLQIEENVLNLIKFVYKNLSWHHLHGEILNTFSLRLEKEKDVLCQIFYSTLC